MTKLELMKLSQGLSDLYTGLETDLIANIAEYLAAGNIDSPTAQWKIQMLAQLGALDKVNISTIAGYAGIAPEMLAGALEATALTAIEELEPGFQELVKEGIVNGTEVPIKKTMTRAIKSYNKQARQSLNMVNTVMRYKAKAAAQKLINDTAELAEKQFFLNTLGKAAGKAVTGAESRQAAMRQCIKEMSEKGIPAFVDKRGREWSPEAYINMDIRTTVSNAAHQAQFDRMEDYGLNLVEVSSHNGARPKCAKDQGKIFNCSGKGGYTTDLHGKSIRYYAWSDSSYGEPDGLLGINCGHHIYPFVPGISYQTYFPYDEEENKEQYKKIQNQRELERRVRKSKRECMMLEKTGDTEGLQKAKETLKTRQQALKQYCTDNDLKYKPDRTAVVDYKKSVSGFTPSDEKNRIAEIKAKAVDKPDRRGIIKVKDVKYLEQAKKRDHKIYITNAAIDKVKKVELSDFSDIQSENMQLKHKELLKIAKNKNDSNEVLLINDLSFKNEVSILGSEFNVSPGKNPFAVSVIINAERQSLVYLHNHPSTNIFSIGDIDTFICEGAIKIMSVVTNQGKVYVMNKSAEYDYNKARMLMVKIYESFKDAKEIDNNEFVKRFLKCCDEGGIEYAKSR